MATLMATNDAMQWAQQQAQALVSEPGGYAVDPQSGTAIGAAVDPQGGGYVEGSGDSGLPPALSAGMTPEQALDSVLFGGLYGIGGMPEKIRGDLDSVAKAAGLPAGFDWTPYLAQAAYDHQQQFGGPYNFRYSNYAHPVVAAVQAAVNEYPTLAQIVPQLTDGSQYWETGNQLRDQQLSRSTNESDAEVYKLVSVLAGPLAASFAPAGAASTTAGFGDAAYAGGGAAAGAGIAPAAAGATGFTSAEAASMPVAELGMVADPATAATATAGGVPASMVGAGSGGAGAISLDQLMAEMPANASINDIGNELANEFTGMPSSSAQATGAATTPPTATPGATGPAGYGDSGYGGASMAEQVGGVSTDPLTTLQGASGGEAGPGGVGGATYGAEPGIIDQVLNFANANPALTMAGVNVAGGLLKGVGDAGMQEGKFQHEKEMQAQKLADEKDLAAWKRRFIQGGSFFDAKLPFSAPAGQRQLRRPDGTPVHGTGIINSGLR